MKSAFTSAALAIMLASQHHHQVGAFAPTSRVQSRVQTQPNLLQRRMVMDSPDPMGLEPSSRKLSTDPTPFFVSLFQNTIQDQDKLPMKMAAVALGMALAMMPLQADAAMSGGRMGGSYSAPRQSMSRPAPSSSYSRGYSSGYSTGYYSRPSVAITPGIGYGYNPFFGFGGGGYYGGPGVISVARGPSFFDLLFFGGFLFVASSILTNAGKGISSGGTMSSWADSARDSMSSLGPGTSVVQLSVALEVPNRDDPNSMLSVLNRLSQTASTDSRVGIQNLTSQVAIELLRRKSSIVSASSAYKHFGDRAKAGRDYESRSIRERSKFERESISKYGGVDYSTGSPRLGGSGSGVSDKATMAVVTLVMAIDGDSTKVPNINSITNVEDALRMIAANSKVDDCLQSVEILWTPEERTETLSVRDVIADYPELRSV
mmetsp:Transcript_125872/g.187869  ORF Transcript_125872/g.187869 Transcript_125872/m.187869 type:complete len:431 (-) Transcript_125872:192-1484(-)